MEKCAECHEERLQAISHSPLSHGVIASSFMLLFFALFLWWTTTRFPVDWLHRRELHLYMIFVIMVAPVTLCVSGLIIFDAFRRNVVGVTRYALLDKDGEAHRHVELHPDTAIDCRVLVKYRVGGWFRETAVLSNARGSDRRRVSSWDGEHFEIGGEIYPIYLALHCLDTGVDMARLYQDHKHYLSHS